MYFKDGMRIIYWVNDMTEKIVVAHVFSVMDQGGAESRTMDIFRHINRKKFHFIFLVHQEKRGYFDEEILRLGGEIYHLKTFRIFNILRFTKTIKIFFKNHRVDVLHNHITSYGAIHHYYAKKSGVGIRIAHMRSEVFGFGLGGLVRQMMALPIKYLANVRLAVTQAAGYKLYKSKSFRVIPNAININKFKFNVAVRNDFRKYHNLDDLFVVGHVGRFSREKNHEFLIRLFKQFHLKRSKSVLLLVGEGPEKNKIIDLIKINGLTDSVIMINSLDNIHSFLCGIDLFVFPSIFEGLPGVVIEAQSASTPILMSSSISREVVFTGLVDSLDVKQFDIWLEKMFDCYNHPINRTQLEVYSKSFDIKISVLEIEKIYQEN